MNTPEFTALPFIQADSDFFHVSCDRADASLPVATNAVFSLLDYVAVPAGADRPARRVYWLDRYNSVFFFDQGYTLDKRADALLPDLGFALLTHADSPTAELTEVQSIDSGLRVRFVVHLDSTAAGMRPGGRVFCDRYRSNKSKRPK